jgi:hypothetical protein
MVLSGADYSSGWMVGNPYLIALRQSCPSAGNNAVSRLRRYERGDKQFQIAWPDDVFARVGLDEPRPQNTAFGAASWSR